MRFVGIYGVHNLWVFPLDDKFNLDFFQLLFCQILQGSFSSCQNFQNVRNNRWIPLYVPRQEIREASLLFGIWNLGHVGNGQCGGRNNNGKGVDRGPRAATLKSMTRYIAAISATFDKLNIPNEDDDEENSSEEEEGTSNRSNSALTCQIKKKKHGGN
jgi:hypothetical protein